MAKKATSKASKPAADTGKAAKSNKGSVYKVIELVGTSPNSWAEAGRNAINSAASTLRDLRVAEVSKLDVKVSKGGELTYRAKMKLSFKYHSA